MSKTTPVSPEPPEESGNGWGGVIRSIQSPLSMFALVVLVCNSVFAIGAAQLGMLKAFTYSIHLFLGIVGAFTLIALMNPRVLYHPRDIQNYPEALEDKPEANKKIIIILLVLLSLYIGKEILQQVKDYKVSDIIATELTNAIRTGENIRFVCDSNPQSNNKVNVLDCQIYPRK